MKPILKNVLIIGAGGVTSYMIIVLMKAFDITDLVIRDGDKLEEKNLDRQLFDKSYIGWFKSEALCHIVNTTYENNAHAKNNSTYVTSANSIDDEDWTIVLCNVDNHPARLAVLQAADMYDFPVIFASNEYFDAQAMLYLPEWKDTEADPRIKFPEILTDKSGSPVSCTGDLQEASPQLALANFSAASLALDMLWRLFVLAPEAQDALWLNEVHKTRNHFEFTKTNYYEQIAADKT